MVYECWHIKGEPQALEVSEFRWLTPQDVCELPLPPADEEVIARLQAEVESLKSFPTQSATSAQLQPASLHAASHTTWYRKGVPYANNL